MSARSMTGFARAKRSLGGVDALISLKSVNHRGLDLHFHMPPVLEPFEPIARAALKNQVSRGHVQVHVALERDSEGSNGSLNTTILERWLALYREAARLIGSGEQPSVEAALRVPGILETDHHLEWRPDLETMLSECFAEALSILNDFRAREGAEIASELQTRTLAVHDLASRMEAIRAGATPAFQERLRTRLADLLQGAAIEPQRIVQEAAILTERSDISEEIMRLKTHASQLLDLLAAGGEKGKKLDFLLQEMNRESNTILSKTGGLGDHGLTLTNLALAAKAEIDKMREQSLNLE